MNKMKKLLVFSCCLMVAVLSVLWIGCKNEISLGAEDTTPVYTLNLTTSDDYNQVTAGVNSSSGSTPESVSYYWFKLYDPNDSTVEQLESDSNDNSTFTVPSTTVPNTESADQKPFKVFCVASFDGNNILSEVVDIDYNGEEFKVGESYSPYLNEKSCDYNGNSVTPGIENKIGNNIFKYTINCTKANDKNVDEFKNIGIYSVSTSIEFTTSSVPNVGEIKATRTEDLGYYAIVPPTGIKYSDASITYGEKISNDNLVGWKFADTTEIIPTVGNKGYAILMADAYDDSKVNSFIDENLNKYYDKENQAWKSTLNVSVIKKELTSNDVDVTLNEESTVCSGNVWNPKVTATLKDGTKLEEGPDYELTYSEDMISEGDKEITVEFVGNYKGTIVLRGEITANDWGKLVIDGDYKYWVDTDGKTSAKVKDNGITWLKESSGGSSAWYGIDNSKESNSEKGIFEEGSRFWVQWLDKTKDKEEWEKYYAQLDDEHKERVDSNRLWIFLCGVTDPAGSEYTTLDPSADMYIQLGDDWDKDDIQAVFISEAIDEPVEKVEYIDNLETSPTKAGNYCKLTLKHFSPYAVYDELTDEEKEMLEKIMNGDISEDELNNMIAEADPTPGETPTNDSLTNFESSEPSMSYITGDQRGYVIIIAISALIIAGITLAFSLKSKKNK